MQNQKTMYPSHHYHNRFVATYAQYVKLMSNDETYIDGTS